MTSSYNLMSDDEEIYLRFFKEEMDGRLLG